MNIPKITVIIPTRERCDTLVKSLQTVTNQDYENLEIIVSDNYSSDGTEDAVRSIQDPRIRYLNTGKRLSMSHNFEFALSHVNAGWVTIIGDDDGLLPSSLSKVAKIIESTQLNVIKSAICYYEWPQLDETSHEVLSIPFGSGTEIRDSRQCISKVVGGHINYGVLPMLYNGGFVNVSVIEDIKAKTGSFYKSLTPDMYSGLAIASVEKSYVFSREPLAINGISKHSTGISYFNKEIKADHSPSQKYSSEDNIPFHKDLPLCADGTKPLSLHALIYESYLQLGVINKDLPKDMHAQQLEIILATPGNHELEIRQWGEIFAQAHGLNYADILAKASRTKKILKIENIARRILDASNRFYVGSKDASIRDIYEASLVADTVIKKMPSRLISLPRVIGRALNKF